jgi:hypothetical protein
MALVEKKAEEYDQIFDSAPQLKIALIKLISGASVTTIAEELVKIESTMDAKSKASIVRIAYFAAMTVREAIVKNAASDITKVLAFDMFNVNNKLNFTKLAIIGHCLIHVGVPRGMAKLARIKLGAQSIFVTDAVNVTTETRRKALSNLKNKSAFDVQACNMIVSILLPGSIA